MLLNHYNLRKAQCLQQRHLAPKFYTELGHVSIIPEGSQGKPEKRDSDKCEFWSRIFEPDSPLTPLCVHSRWAPFDARGLGSTFLSATLLLVLTEALDGSRIPS